MLLGVAAIHFVKQKPYSVLSIWVFVLDDGSNKWCHVEHLCDSAILR